MAWPMPLGSRRLCMSVRLPTTVILVSTIVVSILPMHAAWAQTKSKSPPEQVQSAVQNLIARLRGHTMPKGIVKSNGRIEATQVDVAAKYAGRLVTLTVDEGD